MSAENKSRGVDLGLAVGLCTGLIGAAYYCGNTLREMPGTDEGLALDGLAWALATGFFAALAFTSFLAVLGKSVTTISEEPGKSWVTFSLVMLQFSVYVLIRWFLLWGVPFFAGMGTFLLVKPAIGTGWALAFCFVALLGGFFVAMRVLPSPAIPPDSRVKLSASLGKFRAVVIIIGCFLVAELFVNRCYTFNVEGINSFYQKPATLELKVTLGGIINNKDRLTAEIVRVDAEQTPIASLEFTKYDEGRYIAWRDLDDLAAGIYRVDVFFRNYSESSLLMRIQLHRENNHRRERLAFKLVDGKKE